MLLGMMFISSKAYALHDYDCDGEGQRACCVGDPPSRGTCTAPRNAGEICSIVGFPPCKDGMVCSISSLDPVQATE